MTDWKTIETLRIKPLETVLVFRQRNKNVDMAMTLVNSLISKTDRYEIDDASHWMHLPDVPDKAVMEKLNRDKP